MGRRIIALFVLLLTACSPLTKTQRMERQMFDPQRKIRNHAQHNKLTPEQQAEVKANGGFNPYYVPPKKLKIKMPKRPKR